MMKEEVDPLMSRGSAAMSSSKRTDFCVCGVLTASGVAARDSENIEDDGDALAESKEVSIVCTVDEPVERVLKAVLCFSKGTSKILYMRLEFSHLRSSRPIRQNPFDGDFTVPSNIIYAPWHDPAA